MINTMKAIVVRQPGPPEVLHLEEHPVSDPVPGWVLVKVKAFGLNRSEIFTRQGRSPTVKFPRVLGIEAVGVVESAPGGEFQSGQKVATAMGGMGRQFDGGYGEYTCVPASQVKIIQTSLDWSAFAALPEMIQTAWGSLHTSLQIKSGQTLLIRGGTSSVGLAAAGIAKKHGLTVAATTRKPERISFLRDNNVDHVFVDTGSIASDVHQVFPDGVDCVLELVGTTTLLDSLQTVRRHGVVCMTGIVGNSWTLKDFNPMTEIPVTVKLTSYAGNTDDFINMPLQEILGDIEAGSLKIPLGQVFHLDEIIEAHQALDNNAGQGKIVVVTD